MIQKLVLSLVLLASVFITGCSTTAKKEPDPIIKIKTTVIAPPDELLKNCPVARPPGREQYMKADPEKREELLINHAREQKINVDKCNIVIDNLKQWKKDQLAIQQSKETAEIKPNSN